MALPFVDDDLFASFFQPDEFDAYLPPAAPSPSAVPDDYFFNSGFAAATPQATGKPFTAQTKVPAYAGFADAGADTSAEEAAAFGFPQSAAVPAEQPTSTVTPAGFPQRLAPIPYGAQSPEQQLQTVAPTIPSYSNPERDERLAELDKELKSLGLSQNERLKTAKTKPRISGDQALISVIGSLLPLVVGYAAAKKKGALMGVDAGGQFGTNYLKQIGDENKETQAIAAGEYTQGLAEGKDLRTQQRALEGQRYDKTDDFALEGVKDTNSSRRLEDQQRQQNELADKRYAAQEGLTDKRLAATEAASAARQAQGEQKQGEISSRPYNLALDKQQQTLVAVQQQVKPVLALIDKLDPNGNETMGQAYARAAKAKIFKDSDEAQLQRDNLLTVFKSMRTLFPGSLTEGERAAAERVQGGDAGVPMGTLKKILQKTVANQYDQYNQHVDSLKKAGYNINFERSENPFATGTPASAQSAPNQPASGAAGPPPNSSQYDLKTDTGKQSYVEALKQYNERFKRGQ